MAVSEGPFGGYTDVTEVVSAAAQLEILAEVDKLIALLPNSASGAAGATPDFDAIRPEYEVILRAELAALKAAIDAAPTT